MNRPYGAVDDGALGSQLRGFVVDREHRVLPVLRHDDGEGAQAVAPGSCLVCSSSEIRSCCSRARRTAPWMLIFLALAAERPSKVCSA
jgi:hypothetical protein